MKSKLLLAAGLVALISMIGAPRPTLAALIDCGCNIKLVANESTSSIYLGATIDTTFERSLVDACGKQCNNDKKCKVKTTMRIYVDGKEDKQRTTTYEALYPCGTPIPAPGGPVVRTPQTDAKINSDSTRLKNPEQTDVDSLLKTLD